MTGGVEVAQTSSFAHRRVLSPEALAFVADLVRTFGPRVAELLASRRERQGRFDGGEPLDFLSETAWVRTTDWGVFPVRGDLLDRRVEVVRPPSRQEVIHGLNSDANVFVADFEHPSVGTWDDLVQGQLNLFDAIRRTISVVPQGLNGNGANGDDCALRHRVAVLFVRPRGWDAVEPHLRVDGQSIPGALVDFGLFFFHNATELLERCTAPYFYLPSMESHLEARLWNDVFIRSQHAVGIARATIKAACLVETLPAVFEMDEFLWELREHSCGLHRGRKGLSAAAVRRLVRTCHRRGTHAMGGFGSAQEPTALPPTEGPNESKLRAEKLREVRAGLDGTWVQHPSLVPIAKEVFNAHMPGPNQIGVQREPRALRGDVGWRSGAKSRNGRRLHWSTVRGGGV
jgi:malate synthase